MFYFILLTWFVCASCKKENLNKDIYLYDKPLSTLKKYASGNFEIKYAKGGLTGGDYPITNKQTLSISESHIVWSVEDTVFADSAIEWLPAEDQGNHKTYLMRFYDTRGYPYSWIPTGVIDGLMVFTPPGPDALAFFCQRLP